MCGGKPKHFLLHHEVYDFSLLYQLPDHIRKAVKNGFAISSKFFIWKSTPITLSHLQVKLPGNAGDCICIFYPLWRFLKGWEFMVFAFPPPQACGWRLRQDNLQEQCVVEKSQRKLCVWWCLAAGQHRPFAANWVIGCGPLMDCCFPSWSLISAQPVQFHHAWYKWPASLQRL